MNDVVEIAIRRLYGPGVDSHTRAEEMLRLVADMSPAEAFAVFGGVWSGCDDTWYWRDGLLRLLKRARCEVGSLEDYLPLSEDRAWFAALPPALTVYRGCRRSRVRGMSWTLDRSVAEAFARGHRGVAVPDPTVATGEVDKADVLFASNERDEQEVLVDPKRIRSLTVSDFQPAKG